MPLILKLSAALVSAIAAVPAEAVSIGQSSPLARLRQETLNEEASYRRNLAKDDKSDGKDDWEWLMDGEDSSNDVRPIDPVPCTFKCPQFSIPKPGRECYNTFDDCQCISGYVKNDYQCVQGKNCKDNFQCPANSYRKPGRFCYDDFTDCECQAGYRKTTADTCEEFEVQWLMDGEDSSNDVRPIDPVACTFECPEYSGKKPGRECYNTFDDCACIPGYVKFDSYQCVEGENCKDNFQCPANSYRKPGRFCYDDFTDCECNLGFQKTTKGTCEKP